MTKFAFMLSIALAGPMAFGATQTCGIITGGSSGGEVIASGYTAQLTGQANEGCNVLITFNSDGSITTTSPNPNPFYDSGGDDNEIGIINNTNSVITSIPLSSVSQDIFGFDETGLAQHAQVLGHGRLRHAELMLDLSHRLLGRHQQAQYRAAARLRNDFEHRFHSLDILHRAYACQGI